MAKLLYYNDLVERGICRSRMTLHRMIRDQGFPAGLLISANRRAWLETEVDQFVASRPVKRARDVAKRDAQRAEKLEA